MKIHDEMSRAVASAETDLERLGRVARGQGTRLRRRRQGLAVLGAAAVVAATVGGGSVLVGRDSDSRDLVAADPTSTARPATPTPTAVDPSTGPDLTTRVPMTGPGVVAGLRYAVESLEPGTASEFLGQSDSEAYGELAWSDRDSAGISVIGINVQPGMDYISTCSSDFYRRCTESTLPDGARLTTYEEETPVEGGTGIRRVADLLYADGFRVVVSSTNGRDLPSNGWDITRPEPALTYAQLTEIAREPWWGARIPAAFVAEGEQLPGYVDLDAGAEASEITGSPISPSPQG